ncbi:MAG: DoxX family protein [Crocinitomicaceae bacterium]|nr:DoxX family protein [Flavobacteriales bacterium]NQZ38131.1 DoxX family protein [Crocinitomicaceae bacterium]PHR29167.1 MAG: DoxX family membrane protein [Fluviicola sp.]
MKNIIRVLNKWANSHMSLTMDSIRMILGIFLFIKGIQFASQTELLVDLIQPNDVSSSTLLVAHYVTLVHFAGGILVLFGLLTRLALLFQLPIFIGAVIINVMNGAESVVMAQALFGLIGSIVFILYGSGRYSVDYKMQMEM